jgi:hypothetical protein
MNILIVDKRWDDLVKLITPLDLVLFAGKDLVSSTIRNLQDKKLAIGNFSHVGVIVSSFVLPHIKELQPGEWYVWESTSSLRLPGFENEVPDIFGKHKLGVQIRNLKQVLDVYNGDIYIAKIKNNPLYLNYNLNIQIPSPRQSPVSPEDSPKFKLSTTQELAEIIKVLDKPSEIIVADKIITISEEFDKIIQDIDNVIQEQGNASGELSFEDEDISTNLMVQKIHDTIKEINENIDEAMVIAKEIEKEIDDLCIYFNKFVEDKSRNSKRYKNIIKEIRCIYEIYGNRMYNASALDLLSALYPILRPFRNLKYKALRGLAKLFRNKKIEPNAVFCSQFVAIIYSRLGVIDKDIDIKNFVPVDFLGCDEDGQKNIVSNIYKIIR